MTKREILRAEKRQQKVAVFAFVKAKHICFLGRFGGELPQEETLYPLGGVRRGSPRTPPSSFSFSGTWPATVATGPLSKDNTQVGGLAHFH